MSSPPKDPLIGRSIRGTITIVRRIGEGGMGFVYEAYQEHLQRKLAVKVMTPEHARNPIAADYFEREARSAARIRHPNIIQIIDFGREDDDTLFLAMEFVPGTPLSSVIETQHPLSTKRVIELFSQTLSGLEEAHAHAIIHRDLKPDNLMIETRRDGTDQVKILDFGIAHLRDQVRGGQLTQQGAVIGTPHYMSPEQARGQRVDARSDLFSLGTILYQVLCGELPFPGKHMPEILMKVLTHQPPPPSTVRPDLEIDPQLEAICLRALHKDESLRYQSAASFRRAIQDASSSKPSAHVAPSAKFIFRRKGERTDPRRAPLESASLAPEKKRVVPAPAAPFEASLGEEGSQVVDVSKLFDTPSPAPAAAAAPSAGVGPSASALNASSSTTQLPTAFATPSLRAEAPEEDTPARGAMSALGVDTAALRGELLGERRHLTLVVMHQRVNVSLDAEELFELNDRLEAILVKLCERWHAAVHSRQGSYTTLALGFESPSADDAVRAAHLALALREAVAQAGGARLSCALAIAQGELFAPQGRLERAAGAALSQATEAAQRAADAEVIVPEALLQALLEPAFEFSDEMDRGERAVLRVRAISQTADQGVVRFGELIGRDREVAALLGVLGRLARRQGGTLLITGAGGVGKSALLGQACALAAQREQLTLSARHLHRGVFGLRDLFKQWLRALCVAQAIEPGELEIKLGEVGLASGYAKLLHGLYQESLERLVAFKGSARALPTERDTERALSAAMRRLFIALAERGALVVTLDEVIDFDAPLQAFCSSVQERVASHHPVAMLIAARVEPGQASLALPEQVIRLEVERLEERAALALCEARLSERALPKATLKQIARLSSGNPLHLEQLIATALQSEELDLDALEERLASAPDVNALLRVRLFALTPHAKNVLGVLSVLGDDTEAQMLAQIAHASWRPEETLQALYDQGLLEVEERAEGTAALSFIPAALRLVVYKSLSKRHRTAIHQQAAHYLYEKSASEASSLSHSERLALAGHLEKLGHFERALGELRALYDQACAAFQYAGAAEILARMGSLSRRAAPEDHQRLARYELDLARLLAAQGQGERALDTILKLDRSKRLKAPLDAEVRLELARQWLEQEDPTSLEPMVERLITRLRQESHEDASLSWMLTCALTVLAEIYEKQNNLTRSAEVLLEAIEVIERRSLDARHNPVGPSLIWQPLNQLGRVRTKSQDLQGASSMFELAMSSARRFEDALGEIAVRGNFAALRGMQGRFDEALDHIDAALKLARESGQLRDEAKLLFNQALVLSRQRHIEPAVELLRQSEQLCRELDWREGLAMALSQLKALESSV